jgi:putative ABC transport system ATP-binding protein
VISLKDVTKVYGKQDKQFYALSKINLDIDTGEFAMILGSSGSGKTTLINLIGGIDSVTDGSIYIDEENISSMKTLERSKFRNEKVGYIFQNYQLLPALTVEENIRMPLMIRKGKLNQSFNDELMSKLGITECRNKLPSELSGGEQQRTAIARALVTKPQLILADEPTGNLDSENGTKVIELIRELKTPEQTVIMITHNPSLVKYASRVIEIKDGVIQK